VQDREKPRKPALLIVLINEVCLPGVCSIALCEKPLGANVYEPYEQMDQRSASCSAVCVVRRIAGCRASAGAHLRPQWPALLGLQHPRYGAASGYSGEGYDPRAGN